MSEERAIETILYRFYLISEEASSVLDAELSESIRRDVHCWLESDAHLLQANEERIR